MNYLDSGRSSHMLKLFEFLEQYPKTRNFIKSVSVAALPNKEFDVFSGRELTTQEVGDMGYRIKGNYHNWTLSRPQVKKIWSDCEELYIMKCACSPDKTVLYIPAFTKYIEKYIKEGTINTESFVNEPHIIIMNAKQREEIILPDDYDSGIIVEII